MFSVRHTVRSLCIQHFEHHMFGNQRLCASQTHLERLLAEMSRFCNVNGYWFQSCLTLPCASPPLVRTAMAFPAPLIRSFSKSTCMMKTADVSPSLLKILRCPARWLFLVRSFLLLLTQSTNCESCQRRAHIRTYARTRARPAPPLVCSARSCEATDPRLEQHFSGCYWTIISRSSLFYDIMGNYFLQTINF